MLIAWDPGGLIDVATHVVHYSNTFLILNPSACLGSSPQQTHWNRCRKSSFHVSALPSSPALRHAAQQEKHVRHVGGGAGLRGKGVSVGAGFVNGSAMETQFDFTLDNNQSVRCFDARMLAQKELSLTHTHAHKYTHTYMYIYIQIYPIKKRN